MRLVLLNINIRWKFAFLGMSSFLTWWSIFNVKLDVVQLMMTRRLELFYNLYYQSSDIFPHLYMLWSDTYNANVLWSTLISSNKIVIFTLLFDILTLKLLGFLKIVFFHGGFDSLLHVLKRTNPMLIWFYDFIQLFTNVFKISCS